MFRSQRFARECGSAGAGVPVAFGLVWLLASPLEAGAFETPERVAGVAVVRAPLASEGRQVPVVDRELWICLRAPDRDRRNLLEAHGLEYLRDGVQGNWIKVRTPAPQRLREPLRAKGPSGAARTDPSGLADLMRALTADKRVSGVGANAICRAASEPGDEYYAAQWHLQQIDAPAAWAAAAESDGSPVRIGLLDTGVAYADGVDEATKTRVSRHPDIPWPIFSPMDFVDDDTDAFDLNQHGTHIATIVAGRWDGSGVVGLAHDHALVPVRVLDADGYGTVEDLADGIAYMVRHWGSEAIVHMSLAFPAGYDPGPYLANVISHADSVGAVMVASSGNEGLATVAYPARYNEVIAVGAVDALGRRAPYSNFGPGLDLVAPGGVARDDDGDGQIDAVLAGATARGVPGEVGFWLGAGTSQAAAHVTATLALLRSDEGAALTSLELRNALLRSAVDLGARGWDFEYGYGCVDPGMALARRGAEPVKTLKELGGWVDDPAIRPALHCGRTMGAVVGHPAGLALFLETPEGHFVFMERSSDVGIWQLDNLGLHSLLASPGGPSGWLDENGADPGALVGVVDVPGGLRWILDPEHPLPAGLAGQSVTLVDGPAGQVLEVIGDNGGLLGMLESSGGMIGAMDGSAGLLGILESSGGMIGLMDGGGHVSGYASVAGVPLDSGDLGATEGLVAYP